MSTLGLTFKRDDKNPHTLHADGKAGNYLIQKQTMDGPTPYAVRFAYFKNWTASKGTDQGFCKTEEDAVQWCIQYEKQFH